MTSYPITILLLATLLGLASCSGSSPETAQSDSPTANRQEKVDAAKEKTMGDVVSGYLDIKNALVASNAENAKAAAVALLEVIDATNMPVMQQQTKEMAAATDLEMQRIYFDSLSVALYKRVEDLPSGYQTLFKQYCPMAFNNRGAFWLSSNREIENPYFGDQMMNCGQVEEEIKF